MQINYSKSNSIHRPAHQPPRCPAIAATAMVHGHSAFVFLSSRAQIYIHADVTCVSVRRLCWHLASQSRELPLALWDLRVGTSSIRLNRYRMNGFVPLMPSNRSIPLRWLSQGQIEFNRIKIDLKTFDNSRNMEK
jgi:hypothetical protein